MGSRRAVEGIISDGRVKINGARAELASIVGAGDVVTLDGKVVVLEGQKVYIVMHKPCGYLTTCSDDRGRKTVMDLLPEDLSHMRVFPVGRLDFDTSGLLLLSNDGDFANSVMHPSKKVQKTYIATVNKDVTEAHVFDLMRDADKAKKLDTRVIEIVIHTGKNRQVRRMLASVGLDCVALHRVKIGELTLGNLRAGEIVCHNKPITI